MASLAVLFGFLNVSHSRAFSVLAVLSVMDFALDLPRGIISLYGVLTLYLALFISIYTTIRIPLLIYLNYS